MSETVFNYHLDSENNDEERWRGNQRDVTRGEGKGPYIKTWLGRKVYLQNPQPSDFNVDDVARHLAGINRYTGSSRYSVAQHCVVAARMAELFYPTERYLPAKTLIHDADEAFYGDVSSPLKSLLSEYKALEHKAQLAVEERFDMLFIGDPLVKEVDMRMWLTERETVVPHMGPIESDYGGSLTAFTVDRDDDSFVCWSADRAEEEWHLAYRRLFPWLQ